MSSKFAIIRPDIIITYIVALVPWFCKWSY